MTIDEIATVFDSAYSKLCHFIYDEDVPKRFGDLNISTVYENMRQKVPNIKNAREFTESFKQWDQTSNS